MIFRILLLLLLCPVSYAAECTAYEKLHPTYILTGSHLSTGKCQTCGSCHKNGVFYGTPKLCIACHSGNSGYGAVYMSAKHLPTLTIDCGMCHLTTLFTTGTTKTKTHMAYPQVMCKSCHSGAYTSYGAQGKPRDHPTTVTRNGVKITVTTVDCNYSGCHNTNSF